MTTPLITYQLDGNIALIGLNRPDKRNAINDPLVDELRAAVLRAHEEADVAVLYGHGSNFCAGLDLAEALARATGQIKAPRKRRRHNWHEVFDLIARGPIPFVAALHGAVVGGGLELAMAAHVRVADETVVCGLPEGQRGIFVGGGGSGRIPRLMGVARMTDLMMTGRVYDADEGLAAGLSQYLVDEGQALAKAMELAERIAQNAPMSNFAVMHALPRIAEQAQSQGQFTESLMAAVAESTPEAQRRLRAFLEGRAGKVVKATPGTKGK